MTAPPWSWTAPRTPPKYDWPIRNPGAAVATAAAHIARITICCFTSNLRKKTKFVWSLLRPVDVTLIRGARLGAGSCDLRDAVRDLTAVSAACHEKISLRRNRNLLSNAAAQIQVRGGARLHSPVDFFEEAGL